MEHIRLPLQMLYDMRCIFGIRLIGNYGAGWGVHHKRSWWWRTIYDAWRRYCVGLRSAHIAYCHCNGTYNDAHESKFGGEGHFFEVET